MLKLQEANINKGVIPKRGVYDLTAAIASFATETQNGSSDIANMARPSIISSPYCQ